MNATLALATLVFAAPLAQDKVQFSHRISSGTTLSTEFTMTGSNSESEMVLEYAWNLIVKSVSDSKKEVEVKPSKMKMSFMGNSMDDPDLATVNYTLDENGLPTTGNFASREALIVVGLALGYVPNGELSEGSKFKASWKGQGASMQLEGHFAGMVEHEGRQLPKLQVKTTFTPDGQEDGTISYEAVYDPELGVIIKADGTATVDRQPFTVKLVTKKA
ncbi:MAG: hypothetical protein KF884_06305 [Fimbriimonadaceae bacterium]|nr:hypothetical protein [Fimbriimonadaceae bacterium]QYK59696.1 MAG: hypothetical protein KF884_06305 [Fimbriimonadaceae bacterium]